MHHSVRFVLLVGIFSFLLSSCATFFSHDSAEDAPRFSDIPGIYINSFSPNEDTLALVNYPGYRSYGMFFLITKDSLGKKSLENGFWDYNEAQSESDYYIAPPGYGMLYLGHSNYYRWSSGAHFTGDKKNRRKLILDTLYLTKSLVPERNWKGKPYRFIKMENTDQFPK